MGKWQYLQAFTAQGGDNVENIAYEESDKKSWKVWYHHSVASVKTNSQALAFQVILRRWSKMKDKLSWANQLKELCTSYECGNKEILI